MGPESFNLSFLGRKLNRNEMRALEIVRGLLHESARYAAAQARAAQGKVFEIEQERALVQKEIEKLSVADFVEAWTEQNEQSS